MSLRRTAAAAGVPAMAADSIEELLHQDEVDGHNDALRRDLNALTDCVWRTRNEARPARIRGRSKRRGNNSLARKMGRPIEGGLNTVAACKSADQTSSYAIMRRARSYRGENSGPGTDRWVPSRGWLELRLA